MKKIKKMVVAITLVTLVSSTGVLAAEDSNVISNNENIVESTVESVMPQKAVSMRGAVTKADKVYLEQNNTWEMCIRDRCRYGTVKAIFYRASRTTKKKGYYVSKMRKNW